MATQRQSRDQNDEARAGSEEGGNPRPPEPESEGEADPIADQLRRFYSEVEQEGLPDRFQELLQRLQDEERRAADREGGDS
jgi:hypothetical protein